METDSGICDWLVPSIVPYDFYLFAIIAIQRFEPQGKYQVRLQLGDKIKIQEQTEHWFKGIVLATRKKGVFPKVYSACTLEVEILRNVEFCSRNEKTLFS